jgi:2-keto-4-pentenoate hydratase/2-oxohepta-3-ene-1,7-dioic acid hydratase in catechol pathway
MGRTADRIRLLTYKSNSGAHAGIAVGETLFDADAITGDPRHCDLVALFEDWRRVKPILKKASRGEILSIAKGQPLARIKLLSPLLYPSAVYCAGANYADHVANMARKSGIPVEPDPHELGLKPWHFLKPVRCLVAHDATVAKPSKNLDWEVELAAVIGRAARNVPLDKALDYVAGYTVANDLSARDLGPRQGLSDKSPFRYDWVAHKGFEHSCPTGPWIVPAVEIGDPQNLGLKTWVNGVLKQDSNTSKMLFDTAEQIAHLSTRITLQPGDVVLTGTPAGVGAERGEFLEVGDVVECWVEKIGKLRTKIGPAVG